MFRVVTTVAAEPVSVAEARAQCNVIGTGDDTILAAFISQAREFAEHYTCRSLAPQTLELALDAFPCEDYIDLDRSPVTAITSVKYTDSDGVEQTMPSTDYSLSLYGQSRRINLAYGIAWPSTQDIPDAVRIRYAAGYAAIPAAAKAGLLLLIGHLFENRQAVTNLSINTVPLGALDMLNTVKAWNR